MFFATFVFLFVGCKTQQSAPGQIPDGVTEPEFNIVSIAIIQSDLINTQFEAVLRITNPNDFSLSLFSLNYRLYGNDVFWASGLENDLLYIPAGSTSETKFSFTMNFIDMGRRLLDDIIAMRQVDYRFTGRVEVKPGTGRVSSFNISFDYTGLSEVKRKAD